MSRSTLHFGSRRKELGAVYVLCFVGSRVESMHARRQPSSANPPAGQDAGDRGPVVYKSVGAPPAEGITFKWPVIVLVLAATAIPIELRAAITPLSISVEVDDILK